jgi:hypothetical protein
MRQNDMEALRASVLWLTVERSAIDGRSCRDYVVYGDDGTRLGTARAFPWRRDIPIHLPPTLDVPTLMLRRRRSFPLTGKVDVLDLPAHKRIAVLSRSGRYRDQHGGGAFRDARSFGDRAKEGIFLAAIEALLGGDGTASTGSGPSGFVHVVAGKPAGTLGRAPLPFLTGSQANSSESRNLLRKVMPRRLGDRLFNPAPRGWKLENTLPDAQDPRVRLAAALFAVELSHW